MQLEQRSICRAASLEVFRRRKAFLLCKNPCEGTAVGMGSPPQSAEALPAQRNFQRKFALRQVGSAKFVVLPTIERSKVRNNARLGKSLYRAAPGCQRDRGPFCFGRSPEEPLPRGSFGQLLRGGSTPRFFAQLRSVGSKPTRLAGYCQSTPGPRTTGPAKKPPAAALDSKALAAGRQQKNRRTFVRRFSLPYLLLYALMPRASRSMARSSLSCLRM